MSDQLIARLRNAVPYQGRSEQAFLCHEAADVIEALLAERERLRWALKAIDDGSESPDAITARQALEATDGQA